jgi:hypothetical protein
MTLPAVTITEQDGALGVLPPSAGRLLAVVGVAGSGPIDTPATYARVKDLVSTYASGSALEAAAHYIDTYGRPVLFVRTAAAAGDSGGVSAVTSTALGGTSVVTIASTPTPNDDYELVLKIIAGGTVGTAGITYQLSLDGGRTYGATTALGTANTISVPGAGGVSFALAAGTLIAGATYTARTTAPNYDSTTLGAALDALANSAANWELALFAGPLVAATFDQIETKFNAMFAAGKFHGWVGNTRVPNLAESEASYLTAMNTIFSSKVTKRGSLYSGAQKLISAVSGRQYKRPVAFSTGAREASVSEEVNIADPNLGPLLGVSIRDANGNADEHDESINPGLDDARFGTLRTWDGLSGVYVTRPRLFSAEGSDFQLMPHRRVLDLAHAVLRLYFIRRLNKPIRVDKTTGFILESEALEIEAGATSAMRSVLLAKPKASAVQFSLSRTDNVLSTKTLTGTARVVPLAYPEAINLDVGFYNPALLAQAA